MFDKKEIARRALIRAVMIQADRRRDRRRIVIVVSAVLFVVVLVVAAIVLLPGAVATITKRTAAKYPGSSPFIYKQFEVES